MFTVTVAFSTTAHKLALAYRSIGAARAARDAIQVANQGDEIADDYGQLATLPWKSVAFCVITDLEKYGAYRAEVAVQRLGADSKFQFLLRQDPEMNHMVGNAGSIFPPGDF